MKLTAGCWGCEGIHVECGTAWLLLSGALDSDGIALAISNCQFAKHKKLFYSL